MRRAGRVSARACRAVPIAIAQDGEAETQRERHLLGLCHGVTSFLHGVDEELAHTSLRFGIGRFTTEEEVDGAIEAIVREVLFLQT